MDINELKKKTVLVLGSGKTGIASTIFLSGKANKVLLSERQDKSVVSHDKLVDLTKAGIESEFNQNSNDFINKADLVIISPGISPNSDAVRKINSIGVPIISDIELAKDFVKKPIIAVTGTNGKTTTTSLIAHLINISGKKAVACGNIGKPLIEVINEDEKIDYYVLEISSFQIFYSPTLSCQAAVCLNITADHLDWHGSFNHYIESKKKLFLQQKRDSWAILNFADKIIKSFKLENNIFYFSCFPLDKTCTQSTANLAYFENAKLMLKANSEFHTIIDQHDLKILGSHNIENALASIAVAKIIDLDYVHISKGLKSFQGVEHRLEFVRKVNGKEFYNDSKATNPEATIKAIEAIKTDQKKITLILGGRDKKTDLSEMIKVIREHVNEVILFGEAKDRFQQELNNSNYTQLTIVNDLAEAVTTSLKSKTDVVLFSPACSSFDMFKNYEERGNLFKGLLSRF